MRKLVLGLVFFLSFTIFMETQSAFALIVFDLFDHPDGNQRFPLYGMRYDKIDGSDDKFTGSFQWASFNIDNTGNKKTELAADIALPFTSGVSLTLNDDNSINIKGKFFFGEDAEAQSGNDGVSPDGDANDDYDWTNPYTGIYELDFTYPAADVTTNTIAGSPLSGNLEVCPAGNSGSGTFTLLATTSIDKSKIGIVFDSTQLKGQSNGSCAFFFNTDEHRLNNNHPSFQNQGYFVGRGWFIGSATEDFLFLGMPGVPPAGNGMIGGELLSIDTVALLLAGLQTPAVWMISTFSALGIGAFLFMRNPYNVRNIKVILQDYLDRL